MNTLLLTFSIQKRSLHFILIGLSVLFFSCKKNHDAVVTKMPDPVPVSTEFVKYTIQQGQQYCDQTNFTPTNYSELKFVVKFDSTAIYSTVNAFNQLDINKLTGFSDNGSDHQQFSARFGWRWMDDELHLFGYTYNNAIRRSKDLGKIMIGSENNCSIKVNSNSYTFSLNGIADTMIRTSTTPTATGYKLFPYFGGDEVAPHLVNIWIKEL